MVLLFLHVSSDATTTNPSLTILLHFHFAISTFEYSTIVPTVFVKIAECYLEEDETVEADGAVTKAGMVVESIPDPENHTVLILRYKSTYARVLDSNRKFLQAASRYHDLSQSNTDIVDADDLLQMLGKAATCAILAPSGPPASACFGPRLQRRTPIAARFVARV